MELPISLNRNPSPIQENRVLNGASANYKIGALIAGIIVAIVSATGYGTALITSGASEDIKTIIEETVAEMNSTMTLEEAKIWRAEQDRVEFIDGAIEEYGKEITSLQEDVQQVQRTVDANARTIQAIANKVGAN